MTTTTSTSRRSSADDPSIWRGPTAAGEVVVVQSTRTDGDFHLDHASPAVIDRRRRALVDRPWTMLDEVHGTALVAVSAPGAGDGATGDVLVTDAADAVLGVWTGDCAAVVVVRPDGRLGAAHAGWKGLAAGVLDVLVEAVEPTAGSQAVVGPTIGPCCYEFGSADLAAVAAGVGTVSPAISSTTTADRPSLDVVAAVRLGLARRGVSAVTADGRCTRCAAELFSHRGGDLERHVTAVWRTAGRG